MTESLSQELARLINEWETAPHESSVREEAWHLIADCVTETANAKAILAALSAAEAGEANTETAEYFEPRAVSAIGKVEASAFIPGSFGCHEALHMSHVLAEMVKERLCEHPAIKARPEWARLANQAQEILADLYQKIGEAHL